ncbi:hypothetical protein [Candidatus Williamhamiltonella defendens]|nr:hypothetical protein [Candidatus Hamiltonella defensa]
MTAGATVSPETGVKTVSFSSGTDAPQALLVWALVLSLPTSLSGFHQ